MVGVGLLLQHAHVFNIQVQDAKELGEVYVRELKGMPGTMFEPAIRAVLSGWRNEFRLPVPALIWDVIRTENERLSAELALLQRARGDVLANSMTRSHPAPAPISTSEAARMLAEVQDPKLRAALARLGETVKKREFEP